MRHEAVGRQLAEATLDAARQAGYASVLLDTLVVRTLLVPSLGLTLGERFWWPRKVSAA